MKLIFAVVHQQDATRCSDALSGAGFASTRFGSAGGFLDRDNVTLMIGVDDPLLDSALQVLRNTCSTHHEAVEEAQLDDRLAPAASRAALRLDVEVSGATVFVVDVDRYEKL